ncbi:hypothetical protein AVEN_261897-1 [Araneus ventricosus]|uniref:Uncharacterized protein n=1 Tax=Araneus ventricosus TaxID=182803 RepID=A0A4Y2KTF4_ARAVE|nr:hypothetical protein AVEN_261897-1 [Araneus ventricosus]
MSANIQASRPQTPVNTSASNSRNQQHTYQHAKHTTPRKNSKQHMVNGHGELVNENHTNGMVLSRRIHATADKTGRYNLKIKGKRQPATAAANLYNGVIASYG